MRRGILTVASLGLLACTGGLARGELIYTTAAVGGNPVLSRFDTGSLGVITSVPVTGLQAGETLLDIDVRPRPTSPGVQSLYGLGSTSRIYIVNPLTGTATQIGTTGQFTVNGTKAGIDFNPIPDRIRVASTTRQNLRVNPNDGTLSATDTMLTSGSNVVSVAYDRNFDRTGSSVGALTTLYGIDAVAGTLVTIGGIDGSPSPNNGGLVTIGSLGLGTNLNESIGFDISGSSGLALASITTAGVSRLYSIDLLTGAATLFSSNAGAIGAGTVPFQGLAAAQAPEPTSLAGVALAGLLGLRRRRQAI